MALKFGKRAATYDARDLRFTDVRPKDLKLEDIQNALPNIRPYGGGYGTDFSNWGMLGNGPEDDGSIPAEDTAAIEGAGDCAWAGPAHEEMESAHNAKRPIPRFTCYNVLQQYSAYSGYNLQTGDNDNGSNVRDVLTWRATKGLEDADGKVYKIGAFVSLELGNLRELYEALYLFENVGIGIEVPTSVMDQFNNGQIWSVVPGTSIEGGHYIPLVGHPTSNLWTVVTWGRRQLVTAQFLSTYMDEAWAYIDPERYNQVTGETLQNYKDADLEKYLTLLPQSV